MLFFYGTRASKIKEGKLRGNTTCPHCNSQNSFNYVTYSRYIHFFFIPIFPILKTTVFECSHCKKSYKDDELPPHLKKVFQKEKELNPSKKPLWQGIGCIVIVVLFVLPFLFSLIFAMFGDKSSSTKTHTDSRAELLKQDLKKVTSTPVFETDSISTILKPCITNSIEGINTEGIQYFSKVKDDKILVLLKITTMKKIKKSSRKEVVFAVEDCLDAYLENKKYRYFIGVDGKWNLLLSKSPTEESLGGSFGREAVLYNFYGKKEVTKTE